MAGGVMERKFTARMAVAGLTMVLLVMGLVMGIGSAAASSPPTASPQSAEGGPVQLGSGTQLYPRAIKLEHSGAANGQIIAQTTSFDPNGYGAIWRSTDNGQTFTQIGAVRDPISSSGQCCGTIYELPQAVGTMPARTLLFAASYAQNAPPMVIDLWFSTDHGVSWALKSTVITGANPKGLWEPEIQVNTEGQLTVYYSDETQQPRTARR